MQYIVIMGTIALVALAGCARPIHKPLGAAIESSIPRHNLSEKIDRSQLPVPHQQPPFLPHEPEPAPHLTSLPSRSAIVQSAVRLLGATTIAIQGRRIAYDCAGVTRAIFLEHGIDLYRSTHPEGKANGVRLIHNHVRQYGMLHQDTDVHPGDLVFFDNTWDFNGDGLLNDPLTHVGIVERTEPNGTVIFISRVAGAVSRYHMNLSQPHVHKTTEGHVLNDYLRRKRSTDPDKTARLTGELFSLYGNLLSPQKGKPFKRQFIEQHPYQQQVSDSSAAAVAER
jgi:NlpC/P60 family